MIPAYILSCVLLVLAFQGLSIWPRTMEMLREMRAAFMVFADECLSDDQKEEALRHRSLRVLGLTTKLTLALVLVFGAAAAPVALAVWAGWISWYGFLMFSIEPVVLVATVAALAVYPRVQDWVLSRLATQPANG